MGQIAREEARMGLTHRKPAEHGRSRYDVSEDHGHGHALAPVRPSIAKADADP